MIASMRSAFSACLLALLSATAPAASQTSTTATATSWPPPSYGIKSPDPPHFFAPLKWGCDDEWRFQFGGETRLRMESRDNFNMNDTAHGTDNFYLLRTKYDFELAYKDFFRAFFEVLDARQFDAGPE